MELVPLGPGFGVEVRGVSMLDVATDAEAYKAVRAAFDPFVRGEEVHFTAACWEIRAGAS